MSPHEEDVAAQVLVIGGTRFVGRHIVAALTSAGHDVTLLHRGESGAELFPELARIRRPPARRTC